MIRYLGVCFSLVLTGLALAAVPPVEPRGEPFLRSDSPAGVRHLQTRLTHYLHPSGVRLTLIATIHAAEPAYYAQIDQRLRAADGVVHEAVIRRQTATLGRPDAVTRLGLVAQTAALRTRGDAFVVGDLNETEFEAARDRKVPVAEPPPSLAALAEGVLGVEQNDVVRRLTHAAFAIPERNAAAIQALRHRLTRGDRRIVLLYGAAHAADLDRRLKTELGFAPQHSEWLNAFAY